MGKTMKTVIVNSCLFHKNGLFRNLKAVPYLGGGQLRSDCEIEELKEDFRKYKRNFKRDLKRLRKDGLQQRAYWAALLKDEME